MISAVGFPVIGSGVWGVVHDMGDGTVLKRVRETGGIGSGAEKIAHEIRMMDMLAPYANSLSFAVPRAIGYGTMPPDRDGCTLWARSTKLPGRVWQTADFAKLSDDRRAAVVAGMVRALAEFHAMLDRIDAPVPQNNLWDSVTALRLSAADTERVANVRGMFTGNEILRLLHGDFNPTNILLDDDGRVAGVIDFAEMCRGDLADELAALSVEFPDSRALIVDTYAAAAGVAVSADSMAAAETRSAMLSLLIARYQTADEGAALAMQGRVDAALAVKDSGNFAQAMV